eukprot:1190394-Prorocentrum_minimum.AAC.1
MALAQKHGAYPDPDSSANQSADAHSATQQLLTPLVEPRTLTPLVEPRTPRSPQITATDEKGGGDEIEEEEGVGREGRERRQGPAIGASRG